MIIPPPTRHGSFVKSAFGFAISVYCLLRLAWSVITGFD